MKRVDCGTSQATSTDLILNSIECRLKSQLDRRKENGSFRQLLSLPLPQDINAHAAFFDISKKYINFECNHQMIDFSSNDYLGLARCTHQEVLVSQEFQRARCTFCNTSSPTILGASGSRLLSGDSYYARHLEQYLAYLHNRPCGILFNSGYDANLSILSAIPLQSDFVLLDELVHNSVVMGLRMGRCTQILYFPHNSVKDLKMLLSKITSANNATVDNRIKYHIFVVVESVYSMDGDISPLIGITSALEKYPNSYLIVDEAHGLGIYGRSNASDMSLPGDVISSRYSHAPSSKGEEEFNGGGTGVLAALGIERHSSLLCSIHTFGKGAGCHGAFVAASGTLVEYLVNYARPLVYSTALSPHSLTSIRCAYESMTNSTGEERRKRLFENVRLFRSLLLTGKPFHSSSWTESIQKILLSSPSPIQCILIPGNSLCIMISKELQSRGFDVYPIRSPTVPHGKERIRVILHAHNTQDEVVAFTNVLIDLLDHHIILSSALSHEHTGQQHYPKSKL